MNAYAGQQSLPGAASPIQAGSGRDRIEDRIVHGAVTGCLLLQGGVGWLIQVPR
jgi:hypothetical protein